MVIPRRGYGKIPYPLRGINSIKTSDFYNTLTATR